MQALLFDLRYAFRGLRKSPGFALTVVLTLALGIGANTTIFSVVDAVLLRPLEYDRPEQLVQIQARDPRSGKALSQLSYPDYRELRSQGRTIRSFGVFRYWLFNLSGDEGSEAVLGIWADDSLFSAALHLRPRLGALFAGGGGPGSTRQALLSNGLWHRRYGADPRIVGRTIQVDGLPTTVAGVLPEGFRFPELVPANTPLPTREPDVYLPIGLEPANHNDSGNYNYWVLGRLAPGVGLPAAQGDLAAITRRLAERYPDEVNRTLVAQPLKTRVVGDAREPLLVLFGAVGLVLLIACTNIGGLLITRLAARQREFDIRAALGASRRRLARQLGTEVLVLAALGGAAGVILSIWGIHAVRVAAPGTIPRLREVTLNWRILAFAMAASGLAAVLFGVAPAFRPPSGESVVHDTGRMSVGKGHRRLRLALVVSQVGLSVLLLTGAGLLFRSFIRLASVDPGFDGSNVITMFSLLAPSRYSELAPAIAYQRQVLQRIEALPGVSAVGTVNTLPLSNLGSTSSIYIVGRPMPGPGSMPDVGSRSIGGDYFKVLRIPLVAGRLFSPGDTLGAPGVVVVNQAFVRRFFPGENPLGRKLGLDGNEWTIAGVVGDTRGVALDSAAVPEVSYPYDQAPGPVITLAIRTRDAPRAHLTAIQRTLAAIDPEQSFYAVRTMPELMASSLAQRRFNLWLLGGFAVAALALAALGLYGLIAYSVRQRTREIGIRMALGADRRGVLSLVLREGMLLTLTGLGLGLLAAVPLSRLLASQLYHTARLDPVALGSVVAIFASVAGLASLLPARRAARVDPMTVLREE